MAVCAAGVCAAAPAAQAAPASPRPGWSIAKILNMKSFADLLMLAAVGRRDAWTFGQTGTGRAVAVHWNG